MNHRPIVHLLFKCLDVLRLLSAYSLHYPFC